MEQYDIAIIGAGCVGCAIAQRLARHQVRIAVLEKDADVSMGATKANSGIIHVGYFTKEGSLKEAMNLRGNRLFEEVCPKIGVDFSRIGAIFCAVDEEQTETLQNELALSQKRGIPAEFITDGDKIRELEPQLNDNVISVLHFPTAGIIIPFELTVGLAEHAVLNGADFLLEFEVGSIERNNGAFAINAVDGRSIRAKTVVNAAGVYADKIAGLVGADDFRIIPRRGEYILFDKDALPLKKTAFPTPAKGSKGIVVGPTLHRNSYIGPNANEIESKEGVNTTTAGLNEIIDGAKKIIKYVPLRRAITNFAGIRATAHHRDFIISASKVPNFVNAAGIDSPGLSACLAIAERIEQILKDDCGHDFQEKSGRIPDRPRPVRLADLSEEELVRKIRENPKWGQMICRCENVTEAEIIDACNAPIPCTNADMIKRRVRPGMGRCQGGFCLPKVMKIISREREMIYEKVTKTGGKSQIVYGRTKNLPSEVFRGDRL